MGSEGRYGLLGIDFKWLVWGFVEYGKEEGGLGLVFGFFKEFGFYFDGGVRKGLSSWILWFL